MPVLLRVSQPDQAAILELDLARALDLHRIQLERIRHPRQHRRVDAVGIDVLALVVGDDAVAGDAHAVTLVARVGRGAAQRDLVLARARGPGLGANQLALRGLQPAAGLAGDGARLDHVHVVGDAVHGKLVGALRLQRPGDQRFEIAGQLASGAAGRGQHLVGVELVVHEPAQRVVAFGQARQLGADRRPRRAPLHGLAVVGEVVRHLAEIVLFPSGDLVEQHRHVGGVLGRKGGPQVGIDRCLRRALRRGEGAEGDAECQQRPAQTSGGECGDAMGYAVHGQASTAANGPYVSAQAAPAPSG